MKEETKLPTPAAPAFLECLFEKDSGDCLKIATLKQRNEIKSLFNEYYKVDKVFHEGKEDAVSLFSS